ncbi:MAG: penicillin-binding protein 2, partial [Rubricoccaceae bacterium]|nr:penicillin-binding protein 2 [Rubricoccaceae bacterium]
MYVVLVLLMLMPAGVLFQMVKIHLGEGAVLREQGERQASSFVDLPATRGSIYDAAGRALVVNTARYEVAADPTVSGYEERAGELYSLLGRLTGRGASHFRQLVANRASRQYVLLVRSLDEASKEELVAADFPGLLLKGTFARRYNYGHTASHILGHVNADLAGQDGLELVYDQYLSGVSGRQAVQRDRRGIVKALVGGHVVEPEHGEHLVLTIDLVRQSILEEELLRGLEASGATWGTAIAMDPRTGAILAMANVPDYDPNNVGAYPTSSRRNHAVADRIEPGSTFKLVTAVAALESGVIGLEDSVETGEGWAVFHGRTMRDTHGYGTISFGETIVKSSNVGIARVAETIEEGTFYQHARALGFGQQTWIDLPAEVAGTLKHPDDWSGLTLPWMSTGYEVEATPLQILTAYCALANGGLLVKPYVVNERRDVQGRVTWRAEQDSIRRAFDADTAERLLPWFERVVSEDGTAELAGVEGLRVAGKTGTARTATGGSYSRRYRSSFVGFFPVEEPEVAILVVYDNPQNGYYGGTVAAPVFGRIARRWVGTFPSIAERVAPPGDLAERSEGVVPNVSGMPGVLAAGRL